MTTQQALQQFAQSVVADLRKEQKSKGIRASGRSADSLRHESGARKATIFGADYFEFQEFGRKPGKFPPVGRLRQWVIDKGIASGSVNDPQVKSIAYLIGRKIAKEGTNIYQGKSPSLGIADRIDDRLSALRASIQIAERFAVRSNILRGLEQALGNKL